MYLNPELPPLSSDFASLYFRIRHTFVWNKVFAYRANSALSAETRYIKGRYTRKTFIYKSAIVQYMYTVRLLTAPLVVTQKLSVSMLAEDKSGPEFAQDHKSGLRSSLGLVESRSKFSSNFYVIFRSCDFGNHPTNF